MPSGDRTHLVAYVDHADHVPIGVMAARPRSPVAGQWAAQQRERLARGTDIAWVEIGSDIVRPLLDQPGVEVRNATEIAPLDWRDWEVFFSHLYPLSRVLGDRVTVVYLYNELMSARLERVPIDSLLRSRTLLGRLLRAGTGSTSPGTEWVIERAAPVGDFHRRVRRRWRYEQKKRARRLELSAREAGR
jgi:hypothetical protein